MTDKIEKLKVVNVKNEVNETIIEILKTSLKEVL